MNKVVIWKTTINSYYVQSSLCLKSISPWPFWASFKLWKVLSFALFSYGALDAKIASSSSFPSLDFAAVAGPTHDFDRTPFDWSETGLSPIPKFLPIVKFDFTPTSTSWNEKNLPKLWVHHTRPQHSPRIFSVMWLIGLYHSVILHRDRLIYTEK